MQDARDMDHPANETAVDWRPMLHENLSAVNAVADRVHVDYPEDEAVLAERLSLYPEGCLSLWRGGSIVGYLVSHPWHFKQPPALNVLLEKIPSPASTYYVHDIALLPAARGTGAASAAVSRIVKHATEAGFSNVSLIAVSGSRPFWKRHRFAVVDDPALGPKLKSYDNRAVFMVLALSGSV